MRNEVIHIVGSLVQIGSLRRQRCSWCGHLLLDEDLNNMGWALNEDGSDPGPPGTWPAGELVAVAGDAGSVRILRVVPEEDCPDSVETGQKRLPDNCCAQLDPQVTK